MPVSRAFQQKIDLGGSAANVYETNDRFGRKLKALRNDRFFNF